MKLTEISHDPSTVITSPIYGASCYSMRGKLLQRNVVLLFVLRSHILCPVVILSSCRLPILFWTHYWTNHNYLKSTKKYVYSFDGIEFIFITTKYITSGI